MSVQSERHAALARLMAALDAWWANTEMLKVDLAEAERIDDELAAAREQARSVLDGAP